MKKYLSITLVAVIASIAFMATKSAFAFTDYGTDNDGNQCASELHEDGTCNLIYNKQITLIGNSGNFNVDSVKTVAQPKAPLMAELLKHQAAVRAEICRIINCPAIEK